jgi:hypothetical protein
MGGAPFRGARRMLPLVVALTALLAFAAAWALLSAMLGREDLSRPRCVACDRDVTDRAWPEVDGAPLTCACGATLDGSPGPTLLPTLFPPRRVRGVRARSRRMLLVGLALATLLAALITGDTVLRARGHTWWRVMPETVLLNGVTRRSSDAQAELNRRAKERTLSVAAAQELIADAVSTGLYELDDAVAEIALRDPAGRGAFLERFFNVTATPTIDWQVDEPAPHGSVKIRVRNAASSFVATFARIEAVRIDGAPAAWRLEREPTVGDLYGGRRVILFGGQLICESPGPLSVNGSVVEIDVMLVLGPYTPGVPFDARIDAPPDEAPSPPSEWCVPATTISRTIRTTLPPAQPSPAGSGTP